MTRVQELCRKLSPVLGKKVDGLWRAYLAESGADGKADIEQTLELLAAKYLGASFEPDRAPFPPPSKPFAAAGDIPTCTARVESALAPRRCPATHDNTCESYELPPRAERPSDSNGSGG